MAVIKSQNCIILLDHVAPVAHDIPFNCICMCLHFRGDLLWHLHSVEIHIEVCLATSELVEGAAHRHLL